MFALCGLFVLLFIQSVMKPKGTGRFLMRRLADLYMNKEMCLRKSMFTFIFHVLKVTKVESLMS